MWVNEQFIYLTDGDIDRTLDESEAQLILATRQEVKKAIQSRQKGRQFYKGKGKGRGSPWNDFAKDKRRVHIEQRARCNRCGAIRHWAKECQSAGDAKGARASNSTGRSSTAPSSAAPGQSWYVVSDNLSVLFSFYQRFWFERRGCRAQNVEPQDSG